MGEHPTTGAHRPLRLMLMTAGVTSSYAGYLVQRLLFGEADAPRRLKAAHASAGRRIRQELQALRGPAMKLGQALSVHTADLPEEVIDELMKLQMQAPAMHPSLATAQFARSIGSPPERVFRSFEPEPFAAASLGQVHRAVTHDGKDVAVKIQYPGIRDAAANDLRWLRRLSGAGRTSGHLPVSALDEIETQILAETDYEREARNIEHFHDRLAPLAFVTVPRVLRPHSSRDVLTMTIVPGMHIDAFLARGPSQRTRDRMGAHLMELFYFQILKVGALHADPHWGNYLFRTDGSIGLVDFGCVKHFDEATIDSFRKIYLFPGSRESVEFRRLLEDRYAAAGRRLAPATRRALLTFSQRFYRKVYPPEPSRQDSRFDFGDSRFLAEYMEEATNLFRLKGLLAEDIFMARAEIGLYNTLYRLRARVATSAIVRKYL